MKDKPLGSLFFYHPVNLFIKTGMGRTQKQKAPAEPGLFAQNEILEIT